MKLDNIKINNINNFNSTPNKYHSIISNFKTNINKKYETYVELIDNSYIGKSDAQKSIIDALKIIDINILNSSYMEYAYNTLEQYIKTLKGIYNI